MSNLHFLHHAAAVAFDRFDGDPKV